MLRVGFDTVVFVRALIYPGNWAGQLVFARGGSYRLIVSAPLVAEYLEVLFRSTLRAKYRTLGTTDLDQIRTIIRAAEAVAVDTLPEFARDPADAPVLATAVAGGVDYIVSEDRDLLDLKTYAGIPIVTVQAFLGAL